MSSNLSLPDEFRPFFWDQDFDHLSWESHRNFIIRRILRDGNWDAISWLREQLGDVALRQWIDNHQGGRLSPRQLRFWGIVLDIERQSVNHWIETEKNNPWEKRVSK